jgi:hypothetical protein
VLEALAILLIPYDSLTHLLGMDIHSTAQSLPFTAVLSIPYLLIRGRTLRTNVASKRVAFWLSLALLLFLFVTAINVVIESLGGDYVALDLRIASALRQGLSYTLGLTTFLMFVDALARLGQVACARLLIFSMLPTFALVVWQVVGGTMRAQGFSSEPSLLADMLVWGFIPACLTCAWRAVVRFVLFSLGSLLLFLTFSTTGFMKFGFVVLLHFSARRQFAYAALAVSTFATLLWFVLSSFPENYVVYVIDYMAKKYDETGTLTSGSFTDRFYGLAGPLSGLSSWHGWLGFGLGGDAIHYSKLFDSETEAAIREVKGDTFALSSLQGKVFLYGGIIGYLAYLRAWWLAFNAAQKGHISRYVLPSIFVGSLFSLGAFFLPYTWLWLAIACTAFAKKHVSVAFDDAGELRR